MNCVLWTSSQHPQSLHRLIIGRIHLVDHHLFVEKESSVLLTSIACRSVSWLCCLISIDWLIDRLFDMNQWGIDSIIELIDYQHHPLNLIKLDWYSFNQSINHNDAYNTIIHLIVHTHQCTSCICDAIQFVKVQASHIWTCPNLACWLGISEADHQTSKQHDVSETCSN